MTKKAHEEMIALSRLDDEIAEISHNQEIDTINKIVTVLENNNIHSKNLTEKVHIIIGIVENYCHEVVYHKHKTINYDIMKKEVIKMISTLLNS